MPARLLFTSAETGRVGLSLKPHLVAGRACAFPAAMAAGDIFLAATVGALGAGANRGGGENGRLSERARN